MNAKVIMIKGGLIALFLLLGLWSVITPIYNWMVDALGLEMSFLLGCVIVIFCIFILKKHVVP